MKEHIRGITCTLFDGEIGNFLRFLAGEPYDFYVRWCSRIDGKSMLLPKNSHNYCVSGLELREMAKGSIWELVLHIYPAALDRQMMKANDEILNTYEDFTGSACVGCMIFYDCGYLDFYIKEEQMYRRVYNQLASQGAEDMNAITEENDRRAVLHL